MGLVKAAPSAVAKSIWLSVTNSLVWQEVSIIAFIVLFYASVGYSIVKIITMDIVNMYSQIAANPDLVDFLNTTYSDLSKFNECSVELLLNKSLYKLSDAECEIIVKFCIHTKNYMIFGIFIDPINQLLL